MVGCIRKLTFHNCNYAEYHNCISVITENAILVIMNIM